MKVVFLEPPVLSSADGGNRTPERLYGCSYELYHFPDLANLYCVSTLEAAGFEVRIIDAFLEELSPSGFFDRIKSISGDAFVIHSVLLSRPTDIEVVKRLLTLVPDARIILHGPEPTRLPDQYLFDERITVIRGEPEIALRETLLGNEAPGVSFLENGEVVSRPIDPEVLDVNLLPLPARNHPDIAPFNKKLFNPKFERGPFTSMMGSRGCSFRCFFCVPNSISFAREIEHRRLAGKKPKVAVASAETVVREFTQIKEQGFNSLSIIDDQFLWNKQRTMDICAGVKDLKLEWGMLSRADFLDDPEIICALREAGCTSVDIGVESLSQSTLDYVNKDLRVEKIAEAVRTCKSCGLEPKFNILFGSSPTETPGDLRNTVSQLRKIGVERVMFSIATPFKGTPFYEHATKENFLVDDSDAIDPLNKSMISYPAPGMSKAQLEQETKRAYRSFYLHPVTVWRKLKSIRSFEELWNNIKVAWRIF